MVPPPVYACTFHDEKEDYTCTEIRSMEDGGWGKDIYKCFFLFCIRYNHCCMFLYPFISTIFDPIVVFLATRVRDGEIMHLLQLEASTMDE